MIFMELESVTVWCTRQETLELECVTVWCTRQGTQSGATFKRRGEEKSHYFCTDPNTHTETVKSSCNQQICLNKVKSKIFYCNFETKCKKF